MKKTNAVRILEKLNLPYRLRGFKVDPDDLSAERAAELLGVSPQMVFKTLVARGTGSGVLVVSLSGDSELDLKALAKLSGSKKVEMVPLKEVQKLTGYMRGAVSPLGIKASYPYFLDHSALQFSEIIVSAGIRGTQIELAPRDLAAATGAVVGKIAR